MFGLPTFRYALAHHKPESFTALPPGKKDSGHILYHVYISTTFCIFSQQQGQQLSESPLKLRVNLELIGYEVVHLCS